MSSPPANLLAYRLITGADDASFCERVSELLDSGYVLYGSPTLAVDGERAVVGQALVWPSDRNA